MGRIKCILGRSRIDLLIATLGLISGVAIFTRLYHTLQFLEVEQTAIFSEIPASLSTYSIWLGPRCIGSLKSEVTESDVSFDWKASGELRTALANQEIPMSFTADASFNRLGQLGGLLSNFHIGGNDAFVGATDINPISVALRGTFRGQAFSRTHTIRGPIELKKNSSDSYRLQYEFLPQIDEIAHRFGSQLAHGGFRLVADENGTHTCTVDRPLDLLPYITAIQTLAQKLPLSESFQ